MSRTLSLFLYEKAPGIFIEIVLIAKYEVTVRREGLPESQLCREKTPAMEMLGAFSSDEDAAMLDKAMRFAYEHRKHDRPRGLDY